MLGLNNCLLFPLILLVLPLEILFTDNRQFCHKWSVVQMTCAVAVSWGEVLLDGPVLHPGTALELQQLLLRGRELMIPQGLTWLPQGDASRKQLINLGSALPNPETEPLKSQMPKISISAADIISDE